MPHGSPAKIKCRGEIDRGRVTLKLGPEAGAQMFILYGVLCAVGCSIFSGYQKSRQYLALTSVLPAFNSAITATALQFVRQERFPLRRYPINNVRLNYEGREDVIGLDFEKRYPDNAPFQRAQTLETGFPPEQNRG